MKKLSLLAFTFFLLAICPQVQAQDDEAAVKAVIETMFNGMRAADSAMVHSAFSDDAIMQTIIPKRGVMSVQEGSLQRFLTGVGTPHEQVYDERILDYQIKIDGPMASVWTPYKFYLGKEFSHCGVNSFQLLKKEEGWKIIYIVDTRRIENCPQ